MGGLLSRQRFPVEAPAEPPVRGALHDCCKSGALEGSHASTEFRGPQSFASSCWRCLSRFRSNCVQIQCIGIPIRHFLALWGIGLCLGGNVGPATVLLAIVFWVVSGLGVTAGVHRLWTHQSYEATPIMEAMLMVMFSMADQGTIER